MANRINEHMKDWSINDIMDQDTRNEKIEINFFSQDATIYSINSS